MAIELKGSWTKGFAYDVHIQESTFLGYDEYSYPKFQNSRSTMGELVYQLKYKNKVENVKLIVALLVNSFKGFDYFDYIVPAPFSSQRVNQPVDLIAAELSERINVPVAKVLYKITGSQLLKNIHDKAQKLSHLCHDIQIQNRELIKGRNILLIDDLYESGSTLEASTNILLINGASSVSVLAMTKTKG